MPRQERLCESWLATHPECQLSDHDCFGKAPTVYEHGQKMGLPAVLMAIKQAQVKKGDTLLVERIDHLSKEGVRQTQAMVHSILDAGVDIIILTPVERRYLASENGDPATAMELACFAFVAQFYSGQLPTLHHSIRTTTGMDKTIINSGSIAGWLKRTKKGFNVKPEAADVIKEAFRLCVAGFGLTRITEQLQAKYKSWGRSGKINKTLVRRVLTDVKVLGVFQPHSNGKLVGEPLLNCFPQIIDQDTFDKAQAALANRKQERGASTKFVNLFTGLLVNALDKSPMHLQTFRAKNGRASKRLVSRDSHNKVIGSSSCSIDIHKFEPMILGYLRELGLSSLGVKAGSNEWSCLEELVSSLQDHAGIDKTPGTRQQIRELIKRSVKRICILPVKSGAWKAAPINYEVEIEFRSGARRSLRCFSTGQAVVAGDCTPERAPLYETNDLTAYTTRLREFFASYTDVIDEPEPIVEGEVVELDD
ncbi:MAG: recombinase family protein [Planctomycetaceae bacterium]|nr:recombinase family protein [Planctomycetaceae bacterium]